MKQFRDCVKEAEVQQRAADRERVRRRRQQDREQLQKTLLQLLFLLCLAAVLGAVLFRMEPVRAAASEIFSMERIAAGMDAPDSVDDITVETLSEQEDFENQIFLKPLIWFPADRPAYILEISRSGRTAPGGAACLSRILQG